MRGRRMAAGAGAAISVVLLVSSLPPVSAHEGDRAAAVRGEVARAGKTVLAGKYDGTLIENGKPSKKEWLRFTVGQKRRYVTKYVSRLWVICYQYPNTYYQLPVKFDAPRARIRGGRVDRKWREKYTVDGERYTLKGHLRLRFRGKRPVLGKISLDFANCATKTGDAPYFVPLRAHRRR